jgi:hypothetical protein
MKANMKTNFAVFSLVVLTELTFSASALASGNPKLTNYFEKKISQMRTSANEMDATEHTSGIQLTDINIDLTGQVSFGLSEVLKLTLSTELDFVLVPNDVK